MQEQVEGWAFFESDRDILSEIKEPVSGTKETDGMRTSLPEKRQTVPLAGMIGRNSPPKLSLPPKQAIKPPSRRSRTR